MASSNGETQVIPAQPVMEQEGPIFRALTGKKQTLKDLGLKKIVLVYVDQDNPHADIHVILPATLDKITNLLEDEAIG